MIKHGRIQVAVMDGQGGGIGKALIGCFKQVHPDITITALGTNAVATVNMIKGGANDGVIGENAVAFNAAKMHILVGPIGILMPNGLLGELTPEMAEAIGASDTVKIVIPPRQCNTRLADGTNQSIKFYLEAAAQIFEEEIWTLEGP